MATPRTAEAPGVTSMPGAGRRSSATKRRPGLSVAISAAKSPAQFVRLPAEDREVGLEASHIGHHRDNERWMILSATLPQQKPERNKPGYPLGTRIDEASHGEPAASADRPGSAPRRSCAARPRTHKLRSTHGCAAIQLLRRAVAPLALLVACPSRFEGARVPLELVEEQGTPVPASRPAALRNPIEVPILYSFVEVNPCPP